MKKITLGILLICTSCTSPGATPRSDKYQMEMTLHRTRADIEEIKHDLHTQKIELSILEGKLLNQEDSIAAMKKETFEQHQAKLDNTYQMILSLEKRIAQFEKNQEGVNSHLSQLVKAASEMNKALSQTKNRMNEIEKNLAGHAKSISDISKIKKNIAKVSEFIDKDSQSK